MAGQFTEQLQSSDVIALMIRGLDAPPAPWFSELTNRISSNKDGEHYVWLGSAPVMREFTGGRKPGTLGKNEFRVYNREFEASLEIPISWFQRDHTGQIRMKIAEMVSRAQEHKLNLLSTLMDAASATTCYDQQYYFSSTHVEGNSGTQSNIIYPNVSTTNSPTVAEMEAAILSGIKQLMSLKDDRGEKCNGSAQQFLVIVPLNMMEALAATLKADMVIEGGATRNSTFKAVNTLMNFSVTGMVNPRCTDTTKFRIFRTDAPIKPFVFQVSREISASAIAEGSEHAWKNSTFLFGVDGEYNVGLNQWRGAIEAQLV